MPFLEIKGEYRILGAQPDGDSIRFYPDDKAEWDLVGGTRPVQRNAGGGAQLRLDAIDALETHYAVSGAEVHQPLPLAHQARDQLLSWLGYTSVTRGGTGETVTASIPQAVPGFILTRSADKYGRCIAFAGRGAPPAASGSQVRVDGKLLRTTANYRLLQLGVAYPTYYRDLFSDLRAVFTSAVDQARPRRGVWPGDLTQTGLKVVDLAQIQQDAIVLPKLFRRVAAYLGQGDGNTSLDGFHDYLDHQNDQVFLLPEGHFTGFSTVVEVSGQTVRLIRPPEQLIFEEK